MCAFVCFANNFWCVVCVLSCRCLDKLQVSPPDNPLFCHYATTPTGIHGIKCCKDYNYCNKNLTVPIELKKDEGTFFIFHVIFLKCSLLLCALLVLCLHSSLAVCNLSPKIFQYWPCGGTIVSLFNVITVSCNV